jgi:tetratricopeptide (TPR) repeat protein
VIRKQASLEITGKHAYLFGMKLGIIALLLLSTSLAFSQSASEWTKKGDALDAGGKSRDALAAYQEAEKKSPNDAALLVKIAKQYGDQMPSLGKAAAKDAAETSLAYSRRAVKVSPKSSDPHLAVAISLGKLTPYLGSRAKIEVSREIKSEAETALRLNPKSDYAHHMLGRWHQEMANIGSGTRLLAKVVYGGVPKGSYQKALDHFAKARTINGKRLIHQIEYGRTLAMMGREVDARKEINKALAMRNREADDAESKARARDTLKNL